MRTLLGHLSQLGSFSTQGEVLCTQGLAHLLREHPDARSAFASEIAAVTGLRIDDDLAWRAEARQELDQGRPDLEARTADGMPTVKVEAKLANPRYAQVRQSLAEIGFFSGTELLSTYAAQGHQMDAWLADAEVNRDRNLRLQYLAGLGVNKYEQASIYSGILSGGKWSDSLFTAGPERLQALRAGAMRPRY